MYEYAALINVFGLNFVLLSMVQDNTVKTPGCRSVSIQILRKVI